MGAIYFCSFIILSSMMILNLFIGVITTSMQEAKTALTEEINADAELDETEELIKTLNNMAEDMQVMSEEIQVYVRALCCYPCRVALTERADRRYADRDKEDHVSAYVRLSRNNVIHNQEAEAKRPTAGPTRLSALVGGIQAAPKPSLLDSKAEVEVSK